MANNRREEGKIPIFGDMEPNGEEGIRDQDFKCSKIKELRNHEFIFVFNVLRQFRNLTIATILNY